MVHWGTKQITIQHLGGGRTFEAQLRYKIRETTILSNKLNCILYQIQQSNNQKYKPYYHYKYKQKQQSNRQIIK